jgi:hypothetical protein
MKKEILNNVDSNVFSTVYKEVLKKSLQGVMLTHYNQDDFKEMNTKLGLVRTKNGDIKLVGMAIKNHIDDNGDYVLDNSVKSFYIEKNIVFDIITSKKIGVVSENDSNLIKLNNGKNIQRYQKEATSLFSIELSQLKEKLGIDFFNNVLKKINNIITEPEDYGEKEEEPNFILSVLIKGIYDDSSIGTMKGSNFGDMLLDNYKKMGKEVLNNEGYDFDYNQLAEEAQESYLKFIKEKLPSFLKNGTKSEDIAYNLTNGKGVDWDGNEIDIKIVSIANKGIDVPKNILDDFHNKYLRYYETVVNKKSISFYKFNKLLNKIITTQTMSISDIVSELESNKDDFNEFKKNISKKYIQRKRKGFSI